MGGGGDMYFMTAIISSWQNFVSMHQDTFYLLSYCKHYAVTVFSACFSAACVYFGVCWSATDGQLTCGKHEDRGPFVVHRPHTSWSVLCFASDDYGHLFAHYWGQLNISVVVFFTLWVNNNLYVTHLRWLESIYEHTEITVLQWLSLGHWWMNE